MAAPVKFSPPQFLADPIPGTIRVVKVTGAKGQEKYQLLPNVRPLGDSWREGGNPPTAEFIYKFDDTTLEYAQATPDERKRKLPPTRFEDVFALDSKNPYVLKPDDRIAVLMDRPDGSFVILFDGFTTAPDAQVSATGEACPFTAMGYPVREFDTPITGALWRGSDTPNTSQSAMKTDLPARFNPDGKKNCSPFLDDGSGGNASDYVMVAYSLLNGSTQSPPFSIFMDADFANPDPTVGGTSKVYARQWTILLAAKYILMGNKYETYTRRPDFDTLSHILVTRAPKGSATTYDPKDPTTYSEYDITCQDFDCTDKPSPIALEELIAPHGFACAWRLDTTKTGKPDWWLDIYRKDEPVTIQPLKLQPAGQVADSSQSNLTSLSFTRDSREIINSFAVQTDPCRYQANFILMPQDNTYTVFHLNENGSDGFWDGAEMNYTAADLTMLIQEDGLESPPTPSRSDPSLIRRYAIRRRPALKTLLELDANGKKAKATLSLIVGYNGGPVPGIKRPQIDATVPVVRTVANGGWELLGDRCGVKLTMQDPNNWKIGKAAGATYFANGVVRLIDCLTTPNAAEGRPYFHLLLTCAIEGDRGIKAIAAKRPGSPTSYTILRRDDARDYYKRHFVLDGRYAGRFAERDDTAAAVSHAEARRASHELPRFAGQATIGRIVTYYLVGDKTDKITGRGCSLRTTIASGQNEGPQYPSIVGVDHRYDPEYATILMYDDRRAEPFMAGKEGDLDS
ncbi:MAG: hypothetical protein ACYC56_13665 [Candidatus Aquicultor sp.]